jgi:hypothetical protein
MKFNQVAQEYVVLLVGPFYFFQCLSSICKYRFKVKTKKIQHKLHIPYKLKVHPFRYKRLEIHITRTRCALDCRNRSNLAPFLAGAL